MSSDIGNSRVKSIVTDTHYADLTGSGGTDTHRAELVGENTRTAMLQGTDTRTGFLAGSNTRAAALSGSGYADTRMVRLAGGLTQDTHYAQLEGERNNLHFGEYEGSASGSTLIQTVFFNIHIIVGISWTDILSVGTPATTAGDERTTAIVRFYVTHALFFGHTGPDRMIEYRITRNDPQTTVASGAFTLNGDGYDMHTGVFTAIDDSPPAAGGDAQYTLQMRGTGAIEYASGHAEIWSASRADFHYAFRTGTEGTDTHYAELEGTTIANLEPRLAGEGPVDTHNVLLLGLDAEFANDVGSEESGSGNIQSARPLRAIVDGESDDILTVSVPTQPGAEGRVLRSINGALAVRIGGTQPSRTYRVTVTRLPGTVVYTGMYEIGISLPLLVAARFVDEDVPTDQPQISYVVSTSIISGGTSSERCTGAALSLIRIEESADTHEAVLMGDGIVDTHIAVVDGAITGDTHMAMLEGEDTHHATVSGTDGHVAVVEGSDGRTADLQGAERVDTHGAMLMGSSRARGTSSTSLGGVDQ